MGIVTPQPTQNPLSDRHQIWRACLRDYVMVMDTLYKEINYGDSSTHIGELYTPMFATNVYYCIYRTKRSGARYWQGKFSVRPSESAYL